VSSPSVILYSDFACPFCYLFEPCVRELEQEFGVEVEWRPYELRPEGSPLPDPNGAYLTQAWEMVFELAGQRGIEIRRPSRRPRTRVALEVSELARDRGCQIEYNTGVFEAFFLHDADIGDVATLTDIATRAGLDATEVRECADTQTYTQRIIDGREAGERDRVDGVPTMLIGSSRVVGAESYAVVRGVYEQQC